MAGASSRHVSQNGDQNQNIKGFSPLTTDRRLTRSPVAASNISMSGTSPEIATVVVVVAGASVVVVVGDASVVVVVAGASVVVVVGASVVVVVAVSAAAVVVVDGSVVAGVSSEVTSAAVDEVVAEVVEAVSGSVAASEVVVVVPGGWEVLRTVASVRPTVVVGLSVGGLVAVPVASPPQAMTAPATSAIAMTDGISRKSVPVRG
ncbi:hypothetical protein [Candidatus Spongiisocius sp.]|uniref:hypothetical protein n=1 Tax=Candidatus Spongiisocius sp. TaxID=3101273 RepID=UPI003B5A6B30